MSTSNCTSVFAKIFECGQAGRLGGLSSLRPTKSPSRRISERVGIEILGSNETSPGEAGNGLSLMARGAIVLVLAKSRKVLPRDKVSGSSQRCDCVQSLNWCSNGASVSQAAPENPRRFGSANRVGSLRPGNCRKLS